MKYVFIDAEYTGEHARTTLVSLGLVNGDGEELYLTLNDYDPDQVTDWLRENVLADINPEPTITLKQAYEKMSPWLQDYSKGEQIAVVSAGLGQDWMLMAELYKWAFPEAKYFHGLYHLPDFLNHGKHLDLRTLFSIAGHDPDLDRSTFANKKNILGKRHNALHDAHLARECFLKLLDCPELHYLNDT
jgi:hypothetical protein